MDFCSFHYMDTSPDNESWDNQYYNSLFEYFYYPNSKHNYRRKYPDDDYSHLFLCSIRTPFPTDTQESWDIKRFRSTWEKLITLRFLFYQFLQLVNHKSTHTRYYNDNRDSIGYCISRCIMRPLLDSYDRYICYDYRNIFLKGISQENDRSWNGL